MEQTTTHTGAARVMTAAELRAALEGVPDGSEPRVTTTLLGRVKSIKTTTTPATPRRRHDDPK